MSYNDIPCADHSAITCECKKTIPTLHLAETLRSASTLSADAVSMARRISQFLFNADENNCERLPEPKCFQDELMVTRNNLNSVCNLLSDLSNMLGLE